MKSKYRQLFELKGKTALVTGGAGFLGRHFSSGLAEFGANVAVVDLDSATTRDIAAQLKNDFGIRAEGYGCDISDPDAVQQMAREVADRFGSIDILLNNAASKSRDLDAFFAPFEKYSLPQWREVMSVNIDGMFLVAQAIGKRMAESGRGGSIVQVSSIYGIMASDKRIYEGSCYLGHQISNPAVYSASKAAVVGLTRYLAAYWADKGIRVNALVPGGVESGQNEIFKKNYSARVPMNRMARPQEMVGAVLWLASDASSYVTGQNINVDGGISAC